MLLVLFLYINFTTEYREFINSPKSESIFVNLARGNIKIDEFSGNPIILWFWRSKSDDSKADSLLKNIPIPRNFHLSGVLRWEAKETKDMREKSAKLRLAIHFDSVSVENFLSLISVGFLQRDLNHFKDAFALPVFSDFRNQIFFIGNFTIILVLGLFVLGFVFLIVKFIHYLPVISHRLDPLPHNSLKGIIIMACLLAPVLIFRNIFLAFIIYGIILNLFFNKAEKNWYRALLLLIILFSIFIPTNSFFKFLKGEDRVYQLYRMASYDSEVRITNPKTKEEAEIIAYALKKQRNFDQALSLYEDIYYNQKIRSEAIINNLANLYFLYDELEKAEELYQQALFGTRGEPYFNLGLAKLKKLEYFLAGEYMEEARKRGFTSTGKEPIDIKPSNKEFYNLLLDKKFNLNGPIKLPYLLLFSAIFLLSFLPWKFARPYYCPICGKPVCPTCLEGLGEEWFCKECFGRLKSTKSKDIEEELRDSLSRTRILLRKLLTIIFNFILPGAGLIYKGRNLLGLFIAFFTVTAYLPFLFKSYFIKPAGWLALPLTPILLSISATILFFCYLFSFLLLRGDYAD